MRTWHWNLPNGPEAAVTLPLLLLTLLLFCAALLTDVPQIRTVAARPWALVAGIVVVWLAPALLVVAAAAVVPWVIDGEAAAGVLVGLALVASMPVANSSVGWTQMARGNLALGLALVLVTIFLCPWVTPTLLGWLRLSLSLPEQANLQKLVDNFSGAFFIAWVILPTVAGIACRFLLGERRIATAARWITIASVAALLLLNYVNAALAFPEVIQQSHISVLAATAVLALALSVVGIAAGWLIARLLPLAPDERTALLFGLSMKHTGLALLLAGAVLADQRLAILMIVLATLAQHLTAGIIEWRQNA
jgi:BASS family bile acid:Na+ symporter